MSTPGIAVLGPLSIHGDTAAVSPRDRVVLAALAVQPGDVVSAAALAEALWQDSPPVSWKKVVQGCVQRLRQVLGATAIETVQDGYRLTSAAGDVDTQMFQRLLDRGRELLAVGQPERAQYTLDEALALWRGTPLTDLTRTEAGRIEVARLAELNLEAQEFRLRAALEAGRHEEVLAAAEAAVLKAPLREQRWALLAQAQYRAGRQADALRTLRRARTVLQSELGLDPGTELVELEHSILQQDPRLSTAPEVRDAAPTCPYPGLLSYDVADSELFFGRETDITHCLHRLETAGVLAVVGPSGSGKSSLLRAGVAAALVRVGRHPAVVTPGSRPTTLLTGTTDPDSVLFVDQFEEVFTLCTDEAERAQFLSGLVAEAADSPVVLSMRADRLGEVTAYPDLARLIERGLYLLGPMNCDDLRAAITGPAHASGLLLEPGLVDLLVRDVAGQPGALPLLSHALRRTWEHREGRTLTITGYHATGGIEGCVAQSAEQLYASLTTRQRPLLRQVLLRLVGTDDNGEPVRNQVPRRTLITDPERETIVEALVTARLVSTDRDTVHIAHECLTTAWPRLMTWLDEDVEGQRILRHLTASADAWDGMGRPDSELYRGTRLRKALEWSDTRAAGTVDIPGGTDPDLTPVERAFLTASVETRDAEARAAQEIAREQAHHRRRTRALVASGAALLVVALIAGLLAVRQQHERQAADLAAAIAEAKRVDDASRAEPAFDISTLLALQANRIQDSPETRRAVAAEVTDHPALLRSIPLRDQAESLAPSPDGQSLLVGEHNETVTFRTDSMKEFQRSTAVAAWSMSFRADGRQLLLVGRGIGGLGENIDTASVALSDPRLSSLQFLPTPLSKGDWQYGDDAAFSDDGRFVASAIESQDSTNFSWKTVETAVLVCSVTDLRRPIFTRHDMRAFAVALSPDGSVLYVGTEQPALMAIDVRSGRTISSIPLPAAMVTATLDGGPIWSGLSEDLAVSPDGKTLAIAEVNDVAVYDTATMSVKFVLRGHRELVRSMAYSHDGRLLATGSDDHTAMVWDLSTGGAIATLTGHANTVTAVALSKDDQTLYSAGLDKHLLVWDLTGREQFAARVVHGQDRSRVAGTAVPSPDGRAVIYTGLTSTGETTHFLTIATGRSSPDQDDPGGAPLAAWLPPDYRRVATAAGPIVKIWDAKTGQVIIKRIIGTGDITALTANPDGTAVIVADRSNAVRSVDTKDLSSATAAHFAHRIVTVTANGANSAIALLDDKTYATVNLSDGSVTQSGQLGFTPSAAAVSPDGTHLAVGGSSGEVGLLDLSTGEWAAAPVKSHRMFVSAVSFAPDGRTFVTSSFDSGVQFWSGNDGTPIAGLEVGQDESPAVATMTPDQHTAVVATADGAVYQLDSRFDQWTKHLCAVVGRDMTPAEWQATFSGQAYRPTCPAG